MPGLGLANKRRICPFLIKSLDGVFVRHYWYKHFHLVGSLLVLECNAVC